MIATILIGNSDNRLTQREWSDFCADLETTIEGFAIERHFHGFARPDAPWQNACVVVDIGAGNPFDLVRALRNLARRHEQESIAYTLGETEFARSGIGVASDD